LEVEEGGGIGRGGGVWKGEVLVEKRGIFLNGAGRVEVVGSWRGEGGVGEGFGRVGVRGLDVASFLEKGGGRMSQHRFHNDANKSS
jgi:hypothetical protein